MEDNLIHINGDPRHLWWFYKPGSMWPLPFCKRHSVAIPFEPEDTFLICPECLEQWNFDPFDMDTVSSRRGYVHRKIEGLKIAKRKSIRIDPEGNRVLTRETKNLNDDYFIDTKLSDTDGGLQLMIQVGKRDKSGHKVQMFVEPGTQRLNFDRNDKDQHPAGIFAKVEAQFKNSSQVIKAKGQAKTPKGMSNPK